MIRNYKFRIYPSRKQIELLNYHLWLSKQLWNELLAFSKEFYGLYDKFPRKYTLQSMAKNFGMYSQTQQEVSRRLHDSIMRFFRLKKKDSKAGFPRFKSFNRVKSLCYPQHGFWFEEKKLHITPFGEIQIKKSRELNGEIEALILKKEPSGKWYAVFAIELEKSEPKLHSDSQIGVDLGLLNFATLSNGTVIQNPRYFRELEEKLVFQQKRFSRKIKWSKNFSKQKIKVALIHEKIVNARKDFMHNLSTQLVNSYSLIALENLNIKNLVKNHNLAKSISDVSWYTFTQMLLYKAESAGTKVVLVNPRNTSKECSNCHLIKKELHLNQRIYCCSDCGLNLNRDLNAAINILNKGLTVGQTGINASGNVAKATSMKEECIITAMSTGSVGL